MLTVATPDADELHSTVLVMFFELPLLNLPVAVNFCVPPAVTLAVAGVTAIDLRATEVTDRLVEAEIDPDVAVMVATPAPAVVARP